MFTKLNGVWNQNIDVSQYQLLDGQWAMMLEYE